MFFIITGSIVGVIVILCLVKWALNARKNKPEYWLKKFSRIRRLTCGCNAWVLSHEQMDKLVSEPWGRYGERRKELVYKMLFPSDIKCIDFEKAIETAEQSTKDIRRLFKINNLIIGEDTSSEKSLQRLFTLIERYCGLMKKFYEHKISNPDKKASKMVKARALYTLRINMLRAEERIDAYFVILGWYSKVRCWDDC